MSSKPLLTKSKLSNGMSILYLNTKNDPISACHLFFPVGSVLEQAHQKGISTLMWSLFLKGTKKRSARKLAEDIESLGAYVGTGAHQDYSSLSFYSLSDYFIPTLDIVTEALFEPVMSQEEMEKEKTALIASIKSKKENIFTITNEYLNRHLYQNHPYAFPSSGEESTVSHLRMDQLMRWRARVVAPNQAVLAVASNVPFEKFLPQLEKRFGPNSWPAIDMAWRGVPTPPNLILEKKDLNQQSHFEQAYLMMAFPAPGVSSRDYIPLKLLNCLLGGGMSARLFQSLREKHGLAYDVGTFYPTKKMGSGFYIYLGLQKSNIEQASQGIQNELSSLRNDLVPPEELTQVKNYIKGTFILDHQTNSQRAHYLGWWEILGVASHFDFDYPQEVDGITSEQLQKMAQNLFNRASITVKTLPQEEAKAESPVPVAG